MNMHDWQIKVFVSVIVTEGVWSVARGWASLLGNSNAAWAAGITVCLLLAALALTWTWSQGKA